MKPIKLFLICLLVSISTLMGAQDPPDVSGEFSICTGSTTALTASGETGATFAWYTIASGGTAIANTATFTSPTLSSNTDYYVEQTTGAGTSDRKKVSIIVSLLPSPAQPANVTAAPAELCAGSSSSLTASVDAANHQAVFWYDAPTGGNLLSITDSGEAYVVTPSDTSIYYAQSEAQVFTETFNYTGGAQTFVVPDNVYYIDVDASGGEGGFGNYKAGGRGGRVEATLSVTPGQVLNIYVGGAGQSYGSPYSGGRTGGWNGGGNTSRYNVGAGGGATDIRINGTTLNDRIIVAGGGGGSGGSNCSSGSFSAARGGGLVGETGGGCNGYGASRRGRGGSQTAGGARGCRFGSSYCGGNGSFGIGGNGSPSDGGHYGGAGGGGWYGGGGGSANTGGGGGSSYTDPSLCNSVVHTQGHRSSHGQLIITYTKAATCGTGSRIPVTVNVNTVPSVSVTSDTAICIGNSLTLTASGADTYTWMPGSLTGSSITVNPNTTTTYTVTGTLTAGGCTNDAQVTVTVAEVAASADVTICGGQTTTLTANGSNAYSWEPGGLSGASVDVTPSSTTEYIVTGTETSGCTTKDTVLVTVNPSPSLSVSADTSIESGASVDLSASGADTYSWSPGGATTTTISVSPTVNTMYTVTGTTTTNGCSSSADIDITVIDPMVLTGDNRICEGETASLSVTGGAGASFAWYDAPTGGNLLSSAATYTTPVLNTTTDVYVEQSVGSYTSSRSSFTITVNKLPNPLTPTNLAATPAELCIGGSTDLTADVDKAGAQKVYWYDAETGGTLLAIKDSGEIFTVSPSDTTTYYAQSEIEEITQTFNYTGNVQTFVVPAGVTSIDVDAYGGRGGWGNYKAGGNGGRVQTTLSVTPGQTLNIYVGGQGQSYGSPYSGGRAGGWNGGGNSYRYSAGAGGGATDIRIGGTTLNDRIVVAGGGGGSGGSNCSSGSFTGAQGGGLTGAIGGGCNGNSASRRGRGGSQTGGGARGCRFGSSYCGGNGSFGVGGVGAPSDGGRYGGAGGGGWYGGGGGSADNDGGGGSSYTHPTLCSSVVHTQGVQNGNGALIITYTTAESCGSDTRTAITVNVNQVPTVTVSNDTAICAGNTVTLTASGADTYLWMPGNLTGNSITVTPNATTTYTVTGTLSAGACSSDAQVTVTLSQVINSGDVAICEGTSTTLTASGSNTYSWEPGGLSGGSVTVSPTTTTEYIVTGTEVNGCSTKDTLIVTVHPNPSLTISSDTTIEAGSSININATGADSYSWSPGGETTASISVSPTAHTSYTVTGTTTATGCSSNATMTVSVIDPLVITGDARICAGETAALTATPSSGASIAWYDAETGGNLLASSNNYTTPVLSTNTIYYVEQSLGAYTSDRTAFTIFVTAIPSPSSPTNVAADPPAVCQGESTDLSASVDKANAQKVFWYDAPTGGNLLSVSDSGAAFTVTPTDTTTYYAQSEVEESTQTFNYTGNVQTFIVPAGVTSIEVDAYGGRGGWGNYKAGGNGGRVQTTLSVTPGETLSIYVGGQGQSYGSPYSGGRAGGWNGGGNSYRYSAGAGGGATDIRIGGTTLNDRVVVAGGGGGSGGSNCSSGSFTGGRGGGLTGETGGGCNGNSASRRGRGGTQTGGGARGCRFGSSYCGGNGGFGSGGVGAPSDGGRYGGGGGGGWYGGGGGSADNDGGGGSSYTDPVRCASVTHTQGVQNGNGQLTIRYTIAASCGTDTRVPVTVNVDQPVTVSTMENIQACPGETLTLTASGAAQYQWLPDNLTGASVQVNPMSNTTYTLVGSTASGACTDTVLVNVTLSNPSISLNANTNSICPGDSATLTASGADTYTWMPGNLSGSSITVHPMDTTMYKVTALDANGCTIIDSIRIDVVPSFSLSSTPDTTILENTKAILVASGADSIIWMPGNINNDSIEFLASNAITYYITGYDTSTGCLARDTVNVSIDNMPEVTGTTIILKGASTTLFAEAPSRMTTYAWYDAPTGGNLLSTTNSYTTPPLNDNAIYFVEMDNGGGASLRKCVKVNVIDAESVTANIDQDSICPSGSVNITGGLDNPGRIEWYDAPTGGNLVGSAERDEALAVNPPATMTYYAQGETEEISDTFDFTGNLQTFTVPEGVTSICIDAQGAAGGDAISTTGGQGGRVKASINVTPGEVLNLYIGGQGMSYVSSENTPRLGGWNGGGDATIATASGGGGATDIRIGGTSLLDRIVVVGGGGGAKSDACAATPAGDGGEYTGDDGGACGGTAGAGATQSAGGAGGCNGPTCGTAGSLGQGGSGANSSTATGGGGGGGGWYGGGGGHDLGNGGGGSSYTHLDRTANVVHTKGGSSSDGRIILTYSLNNTGITRAAVSVDVGDYENPEPTFAQLDTIEAENSVTLIAPTANDNCAGVITATTVDPMTYNSPGTYTVNWNYNDGSGNMIAQQQVVIVQAVLPVELLEFTALKEQEMSLLNWTTASELNTKGFRIQRSSDAFSWKDLDFVDAVGNSNDLRHYQYIDKHPLTGNNYYRLMMLDFDNTFDYSGIAQVEFNFTADGIELFPNPTATGQFTVSITDQQFNGEEAILVVYDRLGRKVIEQPFEQRREELSTNALPAGTYTVRVSSGMLHWQARVIVIRD
ncbi:MAG: glycine-rich protein [Bacteroidota bacterium]